jgi:hypothetical protein
VEDYLASVVLDFSGYRVYQDLGHYFGFAD